MSAFQFIFTIASLALLSACGGGASTPQLNQTITIAGSVVGLNTGQQLTLQNNGGNATVLSANGNFSFTLSSAVVDNILLSVGTQPSNQTCTVSNGSASKEITALKSVLITCSDLLYTVSGSVTGLGAGKKISLSNNSGTTIVVSSNGNFNLPVQSNGSYSVKVIAQPLAQFCTVTNGEGVVVATNVSNIGVSCKDNSVTSISVSVLNDTIFYGEAKPILISQSLSDGSTQISNSSYTFSSTVAACAFSELDRGWAFKIPSSQPGVSVSSYQTAKVEFQFYATGAQAGETYALSVLQRVANNFLGQSRTLYASSQRYQDDFELVTTALIPTNAPALSAIKVLVDNSCSLGRWNEFVFELAIHNLTPADAYMLAMSEYQKVFASARLGNIEAAWRYFAVSQQLNNLAASYSNAAILSVANMLLADAPVLNTYQRKVSSLLVDSYGVASAVMLDNASLTVCQAGLCATTLIAVKLP